MEKRQVGAFRWDDESLATVMEQVINAHANTLDMSAKDAYIAKYQSAYQYMKDRLKEGDTALADLVVAQAEIKSKEPELALVDG